MRDGWLTKRRALARYQKLYWTHHQKFVVIDQQLAFLGGIDLCFGRYDDREHTLLDQCHVVTKFPGKDYYQPRVQDFTELERPFTDLVDRTTVPRMPWHDIHCCVDRDAARDLALSTPGSALRVCQCALALISPPLHRCTRTDFIQRWNHHLRKKVAGGSHLDYPCLTLARAPFPQVNLFSRGTCDVQILRSVGTWSLGLPIDAIEYSIHNCYIDLIRNAQHLIYIENQYFISVQNQVADALYERVHRAIEVRLVSLALSLACPSLSLTDTQSRNCRSTE